MLTFFHRYQRAFLILVTVVIIGSFSFFGTFSTLSQGKKEQDFTLVRAIDGSKINHSQVVNLSRFLASDREDGSRPNFCNDGVIRYDLLQTGLADLMVATYFDALKDDLSQRQERVGRYRPYIHPGNGAISAKAVWDRFFPEVTQALQTLQGAPRVSVATFTHLSRLYLQQSFCPPEFLRKFLLYRQSELQAPYDPRLREADLSLFGFHSLQDWFGKNFIDLAAEFILNGAKLAEQKGYVVSKEEAKGDLLRNFQISMQKLAEAKHPVDLTLTQQLRMLGLDEKKAIECWRTILLFRRYFHGIGEATFIDQLPYRDFAAYARETAVVQLYRWPKELHFKTKADVAEFEAYLDAVAETRDTHRLPKAYLPLAEIEKRLPELVQTTYQVSLAERTLAEIGLRASMQEVMEWEKGHWDEIRQTFRSLSLPAEGIAALDKLPPQARSMVDQYAREKLVQLHPEWVRDSLSQASVSEQEIFASKNWISLPSIERPAEFASLLEKGAPIDQYAAGKKTVLKVVSIVQKEPKHLLTWEEAKKGGFLTRKVEESQVKGKPHCRLESFAREAMKALQKDPQDPRWCKQGRDLLNDQFKLERNTLEISRTANEEWMTKQVFSMIPEQWSQMRVPEEGDIAFFYYAQKKMNGEPILEQMNMGKEIVAADAQRFAALNLLQTVQKKHAIVIPIQEEKE